MLRNRNCFVIAFTFVVVCCLRPLSAAAETLVIRGSGGSFPFPIYQQWMQKYAEQHPVKFDYQQLGSGSATPLIEQHVVAFGASDIPVADQELQDAGLIQFPILLSGVTPVVNLEQIGPGELKLSPAVLSEIFLGKITTWNDERIKAINPTLPLPNQEITVVHRINFSGTTWWFTHYLAQTSPGWNEAVGVGTVVNWPVGIGGMGNAGIATIVSNTPGAIGYVTFPHALESQLAYVALRNAEDVFAIPSIRSFESAFEANQLNTLDINPATFLNPAGQQSWPITVMTFIIVEKEQHDMQFAKGLFRFFDWCYQEEADTMAQALGYAPIPDSAVVHVRALWKQVHVNGQPVWP